MKVGQIYEDKMFNAEVEVIDVTDDLVVVIDTQIKRGSGNPYPKPMWEENLKANRFELTEDVEEPEPINEISSEENEESDKSLESIFDY